MSENKTEQSETGKITDTTLRRMQERVGVEVPEPRRYHNDVVTQDGSRHFCWGYGDDNPLYCDANYAKDTRWGGLITAPGFTYTMGENDVPPLPPELKKKLEGDPLSGLGAYQAEMTFEWWKPLTRRGSLLLAQGPGRHPAGGRSHGRQVHSRGAWYFPAQPGWRA